MALSVTSGSGIILPNAKQPGVASTSSNGDRSEERSQTSRKRFGTSSPIVSKFLSHPDELGIVPVAFSGGQVRLGLGGWRRGLVVCQQDHFHATIAWVRKMHAKREKKKEMK